jgi:hypothetical protein
MLQGFGTSGWRQRTESAVPQMQRLVDGRNIARRDGRTRRSVCGLEAAQKHTPEVDAVRVGAQVLVRGGRRAVGGVVRCVIGDRHPLVLVAREVYAPGQSRRDAVPAPARIVVKRIIGAQTSLALCCHCEATDSSLGSLRRAAACGGHQCDIV